MKKPLVALLLLALFALLWGEEKNEKPYPKTIKEATDIAISWLDEKSKERIARSYEGSMVAYHFGWGMGLRNALPIWGNEALIEDSGEKQPDEISGIIMERVRGKLHDALPEEEKKRIQAFMNFVKSEKTLTVPKGTWDEMEDALNAHIESLAPAEPTPYLIKIRYEPTRKNSAGKFRDLTLARVLEFVIQGYVGSAYFTNDHLVIELK